jgi:hypothetical protein
VVGIEIVAVQDPKPARDRQDQRSSGHPRAGAKGNGANHRRVALARRRALKRSSVRSMLDGKGARDCTQGRFSPGATLRLGFRVRLAGLAPLPSRSRRSSSAPLRSNADIPRRSRVADFAPGVLNPEFEIERLHLACLDIRGSGLGRYDQRRFGRTRGVCRDRRPTRSIPPSQ